MRTKALVIGAPPSAWKGPKISLSDGERWLIKPEGDYGGDVEVLLTRPDTSSPSVVPLHDEAVEIERAEYARVAIREGIDPAIPVISVNAKRLA